MTTNQYYLNYVTGLPEESQLNGNEILRQDNIEPLREQDRYLPIANIARIMKKAVPQSAKIAKDAKECVQECISEFISFITSEASDNCQREKRKTINGDDIIHALNVLGFDTYVEPLKAYLYKYRESVKAAERLVNLNLGNQIGKMTSLNGQIEVLLNQQNPFYSNIKEKPAMILPNPPSQSDMAHIPTLRFNADLEDKFKAAAQLETQSSIVGLNALLSSREMIESTTSNDINLLTTNARIGMPASTTSSKEDSITGLNAQQIMSNRQLLKTLMNFSDKKIGSNLNVFDNLGNLTVKGVDANKYNENCIGTTIQVGSVENHINNINNSNDMNNNIAVNTYETVKENIVYPDNNNIYNNNNNNNYYDNNNNNNNNFINFVQASSNNNNFIINQAQPVLGDSNNVITYYILPNSQIDNINYENNIITNNNNNNNNNDGIINNISDNNLIGALVYPSVSIAAKTNFTNLTTVETKKTSENLITLTQLANVASSSSSTKMDHDNSLVNLNKSTVTPCVKANPTCSSTPSLDATKTTTHVEQNASRSRPTITQFKNTPVYVKLTRI